MVNERLVRDLDHSIFTSLCPAVLHTTTPTPTPMAMAKKNNLSYQCPHLYGLHARALSHGGKLHTHSSHAVAAIF